MSSVIAFFLGIALSTSLAFAYDSRDRSGLQQVYFEIAFEPNGREG